MELFLILILAFSLSAVHSKFLAGPDGKRLIVGGEDAKLGELPYQVSLRRGGSHFCGGSLLGEGNVLTAAHCVDGSVTIGLTVVAGTIERATLPPKGQTRFVKKIIVHPNYNKETVENDIAVLFLFRNFAIDSNINTVDIPEQLAETSGDLLVSGWGAEKEGGSGTSVLKKVVVPFVDDKKCRSQYSVESIKDSMLCAGLDEGGKDSCQGDSGGPLVCLGTRKLVGIVSWGDGCAGPNKPGVYTEVSYFSDWIKEQIA